MQVPTFRTLSPSRPACRAVQAVHASHFEHTRPTCIPSACFPTPRSLYRAHPPIPLRCENIDHADVDCTHCMCMHRFSLPPRCSPSPHRPASLSIVFCFQFWGTVNTGCISFHQEAQHRSCGGQAGKKAGATATVCQQHNARRCCCCCRCCPSLLRGDHRGKRIRLLKAGAGSAPPKMRFSERGQWGEGSGAKKRATGGRGVPGSAAAQQLEEWV